MPKAVIYKGMKVNYFECKDCGWVNTGKTLRPNGKFCDPVCMSYVLSLSDNTVEDLPNEPGDEVEALKMRIETLEKNLERVVINSQKQLEELKYKLDKHIMAAFQHQGVQ
jgi:hypothetical protein